MATVNIHEAKTHLSKLLERAQAGEQIVIAKAGVPIVELTPIRKSGVTLGAYEGQWHVDDEAWEAMDIEIAKMWDPELGIDVPEAVKPDPDASA